MWGAEGCPVGWLEGRTIGGVEQMIVKSWVYVCKKTETKKKYITGQYCLLNMDDEKRPQSTNMFRTARSSVECFREFAATWETQYLFFVLSTAKTLSHTIKDVWWTVIHSLRTQCHLDPDEENCHHNHWFSKFWPPAPPTSPTRSTLPCMPLTVCLDFFSPQH